MFMNENVLLEENLLNESLVMSVNEFLSLEFPRNIGFLKLFLNLNPTEEFNTYMKKWNMKKWNMKKCLLNFDATPLLDYLSNSKDSTPLQDILDAISNENNHSPLFSKFFQDVKIQLKLKKYNLTKSLKEISDSTSRKYEI